MKKKNLAVFISGQGSNLQVLLNNKDKFQSLFVVSSRAGAYGIQRAQKENVETKVLASPIDWSDLQAELVERSIDVIFLAGFMRIVPESFVGLWSGRLFNLHPSMLPKFKGLKAIERAYTEGEDVGVTIHHVVPEVDSGKIVLQEISVPATDFPKYSLQQVIEMTHRKEHQLVEKWTQIISDKDSI